ncbi:MAG: hypothetical protein ACMXYM_04085 [Candidatus Woesearchaeota archaeon]
MTEVTNRTIAALLFVAMAVTVFSTAVTLNKLNDVSEFGLTGFAITPNATAQLEISQLTSIRYVIDAVDWENGTVNTSAGNDHCNLTTDGWSSAGYVGCIGFRDPMPGDLVLQNDGNIRVLVEVRILESSQDWIGGTGPLTLIEVKNNLSNSCIGGGEPSDIFGEEATLNTTDQPACSNLNFADGEDRLQYSLKVRVPTDAPPEEKSVVIQSTASASPVP